MTDELSDNVAVEINTDGYRKGTWKCPRCLRDGGTLQYHSSLKGPTDADLLKRARVNLRLHLKRCEVPAMTIDEMRKQIRTLLEDDAGMAGYGADIGTMPLTAAYGFMNYGKSLKDVFVDPFVDVIKTAKGAATELTARAKTAAQVAVETVLSSFIPLYETHYSEIFKKLNKSLEEIKKKYAKVYQANDEAFRDKDARFLAFLYDPSAYITARAVENSPAAAANLLEIFTDGNTGVVTHLLETIRYMKELEMEIRNVSRYNRAVPQRLRRQARTNIDMLPWESTERGSEPILEAQTDGQSVTQRMEKALANPELKKEIEASPMARGMKADGQKILSTLAANLSKDINSVKTVGSLDDIQRISRGRVKIPDMGNLLPQEKQQAEQAAVSAVKQGLSQFYRKSLEGAVKYVQDQGVGPQNAYVRLLQGLLAKVGT